MSTIPNATAELKDGLQFLTGAGVIASADDWLDRAELDGAQVASLIVKGASRFKPATNIEQAIAVLHGEGIINAPGYWKMHAVAGQKCNASSVARLVHKLSEKLQSR